MIDEAEYFRVIEEYFLQKRGNPVLLSPKEWSLIRQWYEASIPQEVVLRAIDRAFEKGKDGEEKEVTTLTYCKQRVKGEYKRHLKSQEGKVPDKAADTKNIQEFLIGLVSSLSFSSEQALAKGDSALCDFLNEKRNKLTTEIVLTVQQDPAPDLQRVEHQLSTMEKEIEQVLVQMISQEQLHRFKEDAMRELKMFQKKLDLTVYQEMVNRAVIKAIRKAYNIPRLSLFYM